MNGIEIQNVSKSFKTTPVLAAVNLSVNPQSITAILGASGSGKTTLLRIIAGFDDADTGTITIGGHTVVDGRRTVRPQHRAVGYVPQDAALFPHLTVAANIAFGVPRRHRNHLADLITTVGLAGLEHRYPHQLSGGQQQRVALARALAIRPRAVLLDEPFSSLDATLREQVRTDVLQILTDTATTTMLVTHDQDEALSVADHIALLDHGHIIASDEPHHLYRTPPTPQVATAIGTANILPGTITAAQIHYALGTLPLPQNTTTTSATCQIMLRPEQIKINTSPDTGLAPATITAIHYHGHDTTIHLTTAADPHTQLIARTPGQTTLNTSQHVWLSTTHTPHIWVQ